MGQEDFNWLEGNSSELSKRNVLKKWGMESKECSTHKIFMTMQRARRPKTSQFLTESNKNKDDVQLGVQEAPQSVISPKLYLLWPLLLPHLQPFFSSLSTGFLLQTGRACSLTPSPPTRCSTLSLWNSAPRSPRQRAFLTTMLKAAAPSITLHCLALLSFSSQQLSLRNAPAPLGCNYHECRVLVCFGHHYFPTTQWVTLTFFVERMDHFRLLTPSPLFQQHKARQKNSEQEKE